MSTLDDEKPANLTAEAEIIDALRSQFTPLVARLLKPETEPALIYTPASADNDAHS